MTLRSMLLVGNLLALTTVSMAAETVHLYLKTSVQGTIRGSKNEVAIETLEIKSPRDIASGVKSPRDVATGQRKRSNSITLQMQGNEAAQQVFKALCNNETIIECKLEMKDPKGKMRMATLVSPSLTQVSVLRKGASSAVYQDVVLSFTYQKIDFDR